MLQVRHDFSNFFHLQRFAIVADVSETADIDAGRSMFLQQLAGCSGEQLEDQERQGVDH